MYSVQYDEDGHILDVFYRGTHVAKVYNQETIDKVTADCDKAVTYSEAARNFLKESDDG